MSPRSAALRPRHWLWPILYVLGLTTALFTWVVLALATGRSGGWMAVLVAIELTLMLRLGTLGRGWTRTTLVVGGTLLTTVLAWWLIAAGQVGSMLGLGILDSGLKMGPNLGLTLIQMAHGTVDLIWLVLALIGGWLLAR